MQVLTYPGKQPLDGEVVARHVVGHSDGVECGGEFGRDHEANLGFFGGHLCGLGFGLGGYRITLTHSRKCRIDAIGDSWRQFIGPLADGLGGNAYCLGASDNGTPEQFNGFLFKHAKLNHSFCFSSTIVFQRPLPCITMVTYRERIIQCIGGCGPENIKRLATAAEISYPGAKKIVDGTSKALNAPNNSKAAKHFKVDSDWLATGEGEMRSARVWPFGDSITPAQFFALPQEVTRSAIDVLLAGVRRLEDDPGPEQLTEASYKGKLTGIVHTQRGRVPRKTKGKKED